MERADEVVLRSDLRMNAELFRRERRLAMILTLAKQSPAQDREIRNGNLRARYDYLPR